jgi:predicted kinase
MSRGALLLRSARAERELAYVPIAGALRHGPRAKPLSRTRRNAPHVVIFVGLPACGKTSFFQHRFAEAYVHVSKDNFRNNGRPAHRQTELLKEALAAGRSLVVDNTNASVEERAPVIADARMHGARIIGYYFDADTRSCAARNRERQGRARIPNVGIFATAKRLVQPQPEEGFHELYSVKLLGGGRFEVTRVDGG